MAIQQNVQSDENQIHLNYGFGCRSRRFALNHGGITGGKHQLRAKALIFGLFYSLFLWIWLLSALAWADSQQCTNLSTYYCGGLSPSTPIEDRCLPRMTDLSELVIQVDTVSMNPLQKRITFIVWHTAEGFHTYGTRCFRTSVFSRIDSYATQNVGGASSMSLLPWDAYAVCVEIGGNNCYSVTVNENCEQLKFWARAWQRNSQGYDECGCTSDTLIIDNPMNLIVGSSRSLFIRPQGIELGPIPCQAQVGDPINVTNGNMYIERKDAVLESDLGLPMTLSRHYNSYAFADPMSMGFGWRHSFEYDLRLDEETGNYMLTEATGRQVLIRRHDLIQGAAHQIRYDVSSRAPYRFTVDTLAGVCILTKQDDSKLYFQNTGRLDSLKDFSNNLVQLYYSDSRLDSVRNSSGRKFVFGYSDSILINVRSSQGDTLVTYDYYENSCLLSKATYADGTFETYVYGDSAYDSHQVVSTTTSDSVTRNYSYDTSGLANSYYLSDGYEKADLDWDIPQVLPSCNFGPQPETLFCAVSIQNGLDISQYDIIQPIDRSRQVAIRHNSDCSDCAVEYEYSSNGMKKVVTFANGAKDSLWHDSRGNIIKLALGANTSLKQQYTWGYDSTFNSPTYVQRASIAKPNDYDKVIFTYDSLGNITRMVETGWKDATHKYYDTSWYSYNAIGQLITIDGPRRDVADTVKFTYYGSGDLQYEIQANGDTTEYGQRDELGHRTWIRSSAGDTTRLVYDTRGRMAKITSKAGTPDSVVQTFSYNVDGDLTSSMRSDSTGLTMYYSSGGYLDSIVNAPGSRYAYEYDSVGNAICEKVYDGDGTLRRQASYEYDNKHQITQIAGLNGDTARFSYTSVGTVDTVWDGFLHQTISRIDSLRRVTESIQFNSSDSIKTQHFYDKHDNVAKVIDPDSNQYVFTYDDKDRVVYDSCAITGVSRYGYDAADNLAWEKNAQGDSISYTYDTLNRPMAVLFPDSLNIRFAYDGTEFSYGMGKLYMDSTDACRVKYQYDSKGRLIREFRKFAQDTATYTTSYHYDKNDNLDTLTYPTGRIVAYEYDSTDRVVRVSLYSDESWTVLADSVSYAPFGDAESWILGNGIRISVGLDSSYRVYSVSTAPDTVSRIIYTLDQAGNITGITNGLDTLANRAFVYDDLYRLTEARSRDYPDTLRKHIYSRNGNRDTVICYTDSTVDTSVYIYANNQLTQVSGANGISFTFDSLGNIIRTVSGIDTTTFQYSDAGTLIGVDSGATASYSYDSQLRRVRKVVAGTTVTKYIPGEDGQILTEYAETAEWDRDYIYLNGQLLARVGSKSGGELYYVINDHLGTPMVLVDSMKTICWRAKWYPFGEIYDEIVSTDNDMRFPGQSSDDETGLYYNRHRYYSPQLGQYYQADPLGLQGGDYNLYRYASGNPLRYTDPYGLFTFNEFAYNAAQFAIGIGDNASFGITKWIRSQSWYGGDCFTNTKSKWYQMGGTSGDVAMAFVPLPVGKVGITSKLFKLHRHHMIPWEFKAMLPEGMNINRYIKLIPAWRHNLKPCGIHTGPKNYNKLWREFFYTRKNPTEMEILNKMYELDKYYNLTSYKWLKP